MLLVAPVTFIVCKELEVSAYPFLFAEILASNIGGTATLISDPPNILIGSAAHLSFNDFLFEIGPVVVLILALQLVVSHWLWGIRLIADPPRTRRAVMSLNAAAAMSDPYLLACSLWVIGGALLAFVLAAQLHLEAATIALTRAADPAAARRPRPYFGAGKRQCRRRLRRSGIGRRCSSSSACSWS